METIGKSPFPKTRGVRTKWTLPPYGDIEINFDIVSLWLGLNLMLPFFYHLTVFTLSQNHSKGTKNNYSLIPE